MKFPYFTVAPLAVFLFTLLSFASFAQQRGMATVTSDQYHGRKTASGQKYDINKLTAAHPTLPFGSVAKVTRLDNDKSVIIKITDRGPFGDSKNIIELSRAAGLKIGLTGMEETKVKIEVMDIEREESIATQKKLTEIPAFTDEDGSETESTTSKTPTPITKDETAVKSVTTPKSGETTPKASVEEIVPETTAKSTATPSQGSTPKTYSIVTESRKGDYKALDFYKAHPSRLESYGYAVQVGAYDKFENVLKEVARLNDKWFTDIVLLTDTKGDKTLYRVALGVFKTKEAASSYQKNAAKKGVKGYVIDAKADSAERVQQFRAMRPTKEGFAVQTAIYTQQSALLDEVNRLVKIGFNNILISTTLKDDIVHYKLLLGPFPDEATGTSYKKSLAKRYNIKGFVVDLSNE